MINDSSKISSLTEYVLYPATWGSVSETYNIWRGMVPDRYDNGTLQDKAYNEDLYSKWEVEDRRNGVMPLREMFISTKLIKEAVKASTEVTSILKFIMDKIRDITDGIIDLGISSNNYSQHSLAFVDKGVLSKGNAPKRGTLNSPFLNKLLLFSPYSPNTICKEYNLSFSMPDNGLGNMIAVQSSNNITGNVNNVDSPSLRDMLKGFTFMEDLNRTIPGNFSEEDMVKLADKFIRYEPDVGKEASERHMRKMLGIDDVGAFNFRGESIVGGDPDLDEVLNNDQTAFDFKYEGMLQGALGALKEESVDLKNYTETIVQNLRHAVQPDLDIEGKKIEQPQNSEETNIKTKLTAKKLAKASGHQLVSTPQLYQKALATGLHDEKVTPLVPIEASLKIYGISGFVPGDLIRINYLPENYRNNVYFQVTKVTQAIGETWDTSLTTQMRIISQNSSLNDVGDVRVSKDYLNTLNLDEMTPELMEIFGNLKPIKLLPITSKTGIEKKPKNISRVFETEIVKLKGKKDKSEFYFPSIWAHPELDDQSDKFTEMIGAIKSTTSADNLRPKITYTHNYEIAGTGGGWKPKGVYAGVDIWIEGMKVGQKVYIELSKNNNKWLVLPGNPSTPYGSGDLTGWQALDNLLGLTIPWDDAIKDPKEPPKTEQVSTAAGPELSPDITIGDINIG
mgnify:CR=1 FL=1